MSHFLEGLPKKEFVYLLLVLVAIAGALFTVFTFLATVAVGEVIGAVLFLVVTALLIGGYMVGLMAFALLVFALPWKRVSRSGEKQSTQSPA